MITFNTDMFRSICQLEQMFMKLESESRFKYVIILQENLQVLLSPQLLMATGCFTLEVIVDYMIALRVQVVLPWQ